MSDQYDSAVVAVLAERKQRNAGAVLESQGTTPDDAAGQQGLAHRAGVPVGVVRADPAAVQRQVERDELDRLSRESPALASWATQPDNYAVARDDIGVLDKITQTLVAPLDIARSFSAAVPRTIGSTLTGAAELFDVVGRRGARSLESLFGLDANMTPLEQQVGNPANVVRRLGEGAKGAADAIDVPVERQTLGTDIAGGVGQLGTQVVQALVAAPTVIPALLSQGADQMADRVSAAGAEDTLAGDVSILGGAAITGLTEKYGLDKLLNRVPPKIKNGVLKRIADVFAGGGIEAAQEVTEGIAQDLLTKGLLDADYQVGEGLLRQAEAAGGAGAIARLAVNVLSGRRAHATAQAERGQVDALVDLAGQSKTRTRAPEQFEALVDEIAPDRMVYVPVEALQAHYATQKMDPVEAINTLAGNANAYAEAIATGAEVGIPLNRYVSRIGTDAHGALAGQVRLTPGEDIKPDAVMPDRAQIEADIVAGLAEARDAGPAGEQLRSDLHNRPLLTDPALADDWEGYQSAIARAREAERHSRDLERQRVQAIAQDKQQWKLTRSEVEQELRTHPVYRAERLLRLGKQPDDSPAVNPVKLDHAAVVAAIGEERASKLKGMTRKHGGATPDEAAALLGYSSGAKLLHDLGTAPTFDDVVRLEVDARMAARSSPQEGDQDTATDAQAEVLLREVRALESRNGGIRTHDEALREIARRLIDGKQAHEVQPHVYRQAEAKAAREAYIAAGRQDWRTAMAARRRQLQNLYLYREARNAREAVTASGKRFAQLSKRNSLAKVGKAGSDYQEQLLALLARFDFRPLTGPQIDERTSLAKWIKAKAEQGVVIDLPPVIADEAFRAPFRKLKVGEIRELRQAVEHIVHMANEANVLRVGEQAYDRMMVDESMALSVLDGNRKRRTNTGDATLGEKARDELYKARAITGAATDLARELDGFNDDGAVWAHTVGVMRKANDRTSEELDKAQETLAQTKLRHYSKAELRALKDKRHFPGIGDWSKARVLALALNWGNAGNREAILTQAVDRIAPEQAGTLLGSLDARDWAFVQDVWQQIDSYWPAIAETSRRRTGLSPAKVPASPFTVRTSDGQELTIPGGYFPLKYQADSVKAMREEAGAYYDAIRTGRFAKAATRDGHTIERIGSGGKTVILDLDVVASHLRDVIRDLHLGDAVNFVHQALHGEQFGKSVRDAGMVQIVKGMDFWLRDAASGEMGLRTIGEQTVRVLRTNFTAAVLTWKATSALLQLTGVLQSSIVLGKGPMLDGILRFTRHPVAMTRYAQDASPFMRRRLQTHVEAVQMVMNAEAGRLSAARAEMIRRGYWMIGRVQGLVDVTTWIAAEKQGMAKFNGNVAKARTYADDVVSRAQGSGEFIDKNAMQRGTLSDNTRQNEYIRATTTLMGYLLAKQNVGYEAVRKTNVRDVRSAGKLAGNLVLLFAAEGMIAAMIRGRFPDDEEQDGSEVDDWLRLAAREGAANLFGGIPGLSQMVTELRGYTDRGLISELWHSVAEVRTQAGQGEADKAGAKATIKLGGLLTGLPSSQINKTVDAVAAARDGEEVTPWEYVNGPQ